MNDFISETYEKELTVWKVYYCQIIMESIHILDENMLQYCNHKFNIQDNYHHERFNFRDR